MGVFFGTDGIRGKVNSDLTFDLAYKCGNALGASVSKPTILMGQDTRVSGSLLTMAFAGGAMNAGAKIIDVGICPTACVAFLTREVGADFGVMISASHNPSEYNGIKIFDKNGLKLGDEKENALERKFVHSVTVAPNNIGSYIQKYNLVRKYQKHLMSCCKQLVGKKVVIDASNGASYKIAPAVFEKLGAKVIKLSCKRDGANINNQCGSLYPDEMSKVVVENNADFGFAFDGDSDRIIACDEKGNILDGDMLLFALAKYLKCQNKLKDNTVVGTRHTNIGIERELNRLGIELERTDIGDKYVLERMEQKGLNLGGEKSGHIIMLDYATTGDGVLSALQIATMSVELNKPFSELTKVKLCPQCNIDCKVKDKMRVINSESLTKKISQEEKFLPKGSRIMVRVSGTEKKIRIMVECEDEKLANESAKRIADVVFNIDHKEI